MQLGYVIIEPDGRETLGQAALADDKPLFPQLRHIIVDALGVDEIEHVNVWHNGGYTDMFVDECGMLKGLPINEKATAIYRANVLAHEKPPPDPRSLPWICGTAVLFSRKVWT